MTKSELIEGLKDLDDDEIKNRISMALKDPILQQGFEIICRENVELKKQQFSLRNERNTFLAQNEQYEKDLIDFNENLTKAKEILRGLYFIVQGRIDYENNTGIADEMWRAEQFLKG